MRSLPRFTFCLRQISVSLFEENRQVPRRPAHLGAHPRASASAARDPAAPGASSSHGQTSGSISRGSSRSRHIARVTVQAMAGIFGGLQSLHTDAYDEALSCPTEFGARIAVNTQNILREEAHLTDVIDPLGGSYYVEALTDEMEQKILAVMGEIGYPPAACTRRRRQGLPQKMIGRIRARFQEKIDSGEQTVVGVNGLPGGRRPKRAPGAAHARPGEDALAHPPRSKRTSGSVRRPRCARRGDGPGRRGQRSETECLRAPWSRRPEAGCTLAKSCATLRRELGFGQPLVMV